MFVFPYFGLITFLIQFVEWKADQVAVVNNNTTLPPPHERESGAAMRPPGENRHAVIPDLPLFLIPEPNRFI